jgi:hypothetical protein
MLSGRECRAFQDPSGLARMAEAGIDLSLVGDEFPIASVAEEADAASVVYDRLLVAGSSADASHDGTREPELAGIAAE